MGIEMSADKERFQAIATELQAVAQGYYERTLADETLVWYIQDLMDIDVKLISMALRKHVNTPGECKFFPKPGQIRALIEPPTSEVAAAAWLAVDKLIRTRGRYQSVTIADCDAAEVINAMGGWVAICSSNNEREHESKRAEFMRRYEGLKTRVRLTQQQGQATLTGLVDQVRQLAGSAEKRLENRATGVQLQTRDVSAGV